MAQRPARGHRVAHRELSQHCAVDVARGDRGPAPPQSVLTAMAYRLLADTVLVVHLVFIAFVGLGGLLVLRWPRLAWLHLPAVAWGAWTDFSGRIRPLTPLEVDLRARGGEGTYRGGFIEHYL